MSYISCFGHAGIFWCVQQQQQQSSTRQNTHNSQIKRLGRQDTTYTTAEREAAELGGVPARPCEAVLLGQQQHEGHSQRQVVEAVHVGVVPLLLGGDKEGQQGTNQWP